jgi:hypothetical protein
MVTRWSIALSLALTACSREARKRSIESPDVLPPPPAAAPVSRFSVPLEYDLAAVQRIVERAVPERFGSMDSVRTVGTDTRRHYAYEVSRGPFTTFAEGNLLHLRSTLSYSARGYYKPLIGPTLSAGCGNGEDQPRIVVELATPLTLTENWRLASRAHIVRVEPATEEARDRCDVSILRHDVTARIVDAAREALAGKLADIDRTIGRVNLRPHVLEWWRVLSQPIAIADGVWLVLGPERLRIGQVRGRSRTLTVPVSLDAHPRIVTGSAPTIGVVDLPPLARDSASEGFHIVMDVVIDYESASRAITLAARGKTFVHATRRVTLQSVTATPQARGRLALAVEFAGDAAGTIRLIGTPQLDSAGSEIRVPDLDFDLETDSPLLRTYSWLKSESVRAALRVRARVPVEPALTRGRHLLVEGLNRKIGDAVTLSASVNSVAARALFVTRDGLILRADATGRAAMTVRQR